MTSGPLSGNFIYRHHVEPRVKLYSPRKESFPIPLKYIDVSRTTHTNLDVKQEKTAYIQARSSMARTLEVNGKARQAEGEAKVVE